MAGKVNESFLKDHSCVVIQNGINLDTFYPKKSRTKFDELYNLSGKFIVLGVASTWDKRKGLEEFVQLNDLIDHNIYCIVLVGLSKSQIQKLPKSIIGIDRTENVSQLADLYSAADVFLNPTLEDTFPTTNLESLACGTPVITYKTGGSVESVNEDTGFIVNKGDVHGLLIAMNDIRSIGKKFYEQNCRTRAVENFDKNIKFKDYLELYKNILKNKDGE